MTVRLLLSCAAVAALAVSGCQRANPPAEETAATADGHGSDAAASASNSSAGGAATGSDSAAGTSGTATSGAPPPADPAPGPAATRSGQEQPITSLEENRERLSPAGASSGPTAPRPTH